MNEELKLNDEQLRLATSRTLPGDVSLDGETVAARDGFLLLGSAVEAAGGSFDESALLARLQKSCVATPMVVSQRREAARDWVSVALAGALAAAGLVAMVRIAAESTSGEPRLVAKIKGGFDGPREIPSWSPVRAVPAWDDSLDEEIALASARIEQFTSRSRGFDDSLLEMNDQLKALSQELTNETL